MGMAARCTAVHTYCGDFLHPRPPFPTHSSALWHGAWIFGWPMVSGSHSINSLDGKLPGNVSDVSHSVIRDPVPLCQLWSVTEFLSLSRGVFCVLVTESDN